MGWLKRRRCLHEHQRCIHGDEINAVRGNRAQCLDCGRYLPHLPFICSEAGGYHLSRFDG